MRQPENRCGRQSEVIARARRQRTANDQVDAATGTHLIEDHFAAQREGLDQLAIALDATGVGHDIHDVAHLERTDVDLNRERTGVFLGVEENRRDLATERHPTEALIGNKRNVLARRPDHRIGRRFARGTRPHHIADIGNQVPLFLEVLDECHRPALAVFLGDKRRTRACIFEHGQRMQRDIGTAPGIRRWRKVIGIGLTRHFENADCDALSNLGPTGEPFSICPTLNDIARMGVSSRCLFGHVMEEIKHQQGLFERLGGDRRDRCIVKQINQRLDVIPTNHRPQEFGRPSGGQQVHDKVAMGDRRQKRGFDLGRIVHAGRDPMGQQIQQELALAGRWILQKFNDGRSLGNIKRQRGNAQRSALGDVFTVGLEHR